MGMRLQKCLHVAKDEKSSCFLGKKRRSPAGRNWKRRRSHHVDRDEIMQSESDDSDAATSLDTDGSVSCQSISAHDQFQDGGGIDDDDTPPLAEAGAAASMASPTLATHITDCHPLANGWFDVETGLIGLCIGSPQSSPSASDTLQFSKMEEKYCRPSPMHPFASDGSFVLSAERLLDRLQMNQRDGVIEHVQGRLLNSHDSHTYYGSRANLRFLETGGAFYSFTCRTYLTPYERDMMRTMANMSSFDSEQEENFVPGFDADNIHDVEKYTFVIQKSAYLLPGVHLRNLTPELLSSTEYHRNCQPYGAEIWDHQDPATFRFTRPIVPHVYYMTIQFRVSRIEGEDLDALSRLMSIRVDHGILMERTKRSKPPKVDGTAKAKSILCYTSVPGGVLVTHATVILNTAIPSAASGVIHTFGGMGLRETCETTERTRRYMYLARLQNNETTTCTCRSSCNSM